MTSAVTNSSTERLPISDEKDSSHHHDVIDEEAGDHPEVDKSFRVTLEPGLFILLFGLMMASVVFQVLALDKACRVNAGYSGKKRLT